MEIRENRVLKAENGVELQIVKEFKGLYIAVNYGKLCDRDKYLVEPYTAKDGDTYIHVIKRLKQDIPVEEQIEQALKEKDDYEETIIIPTCTTDEDKIAYQIREVLEEAELYYTFDYDLCPCFCVAYEYDNKETMLTVQYMFGIIRADILYPVDIPTKYRGIVALYVCEHNKKRFAKWRFNIEDGTLCMEFRLMIDNADYFEKKSFKKQLQLTLDGFFSEANQIDELCKGIVSEEQFILYSNIFMNGLISIVNGKTSPSSPKGSIDSEKATYEDYNQDEIDRCIDRFAKGEVKAFKEFLNLGLEKEEDTSTPSSPRLPFIDAI